MQPSRSCIIIVYTSLVRHFPSPSGCSPLSSSALLSRSDEKEDRLHFNKIPELLYSLSALHRQLIMRPKTAPFGLSREASPELLIYLATVEQILPLLRHDLSASQEIIIRSVMRLSPRPGFEGLF
jgi:hypothetical protein